MEYVKLVDAYLEQTALEPKISLPVHAHFGNVLVEVSMLVLPMQYSWRRLGKLLKKKKTPPSLGVLPQQCAQSGVGNLFKELPLPSPKGANAVVSPGKCGQSL